MKTHKAARRSKVRLERRPIEIQVAIGLIANARDLLRRCGCKNAADAAARAMKSAEGAKRHAERRAMEDANGR